MPLALGQSTRSVWLFSAHAAATDCDWAWNRRKLFKAPSGIAAIATFMI
jgi:hypothetical protein